MTVLVDGNGNTYSNDLFEDAMNMIWISNQNNLDDLPDDYTILGNGQLDFDGNWWDGKIDGDGYFHAGWDSPGGQAVSVLTDDGRIMVTFTGTNDTSDLTAITGFGNGNYLDGFEDYLEAVAEFADENGYVIDLVTGKSLGGAATNILFERTDIANGAFAGAYYFGMAASYIADNSANLINFGYDNDYAYRFYQDVFGGLEKGDASGPENIVFYNEEYADSSWRGFVDLSSHQYKDVELGMAAVLTSDFSDIMEQDDLIVIAGGDSGNTAFDIDLNVALDRTDADTDRTFFISTGNRTETVEGTDLDDYALLGNKNDVFYGNDGDDVLYAEGGHDTLYGGSGKDYLDGGNRNDTIYGGRHDDEIYGGSGDDVIYGGTQSDLIYAGEDDDIVWGDNGQDTVYLEEGNDTFNDNTQNSRYGNDIVYGGAGNDVINCDGGKDYLDGGAGNDILTGGRNVDTFVFDGQGSDIITDFNTSEDIFMLAVPMDDYSVDWSESDDGLVCTTESGGEIVFAGLDMDDYGDIQFA